MICHCLKTNESNDRPRTVKKLGRRKNGREGGDDADHSRPRLRGRFLARSSYLRAVAGAVAAIVLIAVSLNWSLQHGSARGTAALAEAGQAARQDTAGAASKDTESAGRNLLELTVGLDGFRMPCRECHAHLGPPPKDPTVRGGGPHQHVVLEHGENNRCFNCHHPSPDRYGSFVRHDGSVILLDSVEQLCGKCHGPHYRAWKRGAHGQRTGYWDVDKGRQTTARCNLCHDPHQPYLKPIPTLPGPRSRRGETLPDHDCRKES